MKHKLASAAAMTLALALALPAYAQTEANPLVGSWKMVSFQQKKVSDGSVINPQGQSPQGRVIYAPNGRFTSFSTSSDRKVAGPDMTDAERLELFKTMFAFSGTYRLEGNKVLTKTDVAWRADWVGREGGSFFKIEGDKLTFESLAPFRSVRGEDVVAITVFQREK